MSDTWWGDKRKDFREKIDSDGAENFMKWSVTHATIFTGHTHPASIEEYNILSPTRWGKYLDVKNGTRTHQVYCLSFVDSNVSKMGCIKEFGGGFGEMSKLCHEMGFDGDYHIYDFPELIEIQKSYLKDFNIVYHDNLESWLSVKSDLMIAICSLSESSDYDIEKVMNSKNHKKHIIRYQMIWGDRNNHDFFLGMTIPHFPSHGISSRVISS